ncbi:uncharacterized protein LOC106648572 isoform X1 [Trichogramma pretiosum]|uniref:uncharacterized protein LOC106648572 isoform X1 n=1 Tax=Trichogramma pretiosum TaxID=7493 RepID=UPI000C718E0E|nr:uncharacterized protein LOC106648572 isoform X1 [Trichogramma pretiosum]
MDDNRLHKYYRNQGFSWRTLVYNYLLTDRYFREIFHFGPYCGPLTAITCLLVLLVLVYTTTSWSIFLVNVKRYNDLRGSVEKKVPTQDSVQQLKPGYVCINKHLMQAGVFLDKTQKVLLKEQMEIDMLNSRMNSIFELLQPSEKSGSKSHRDIYNFDSSLQKTEFI